MLCYLALVVFISISAGVVVIRFSHSPSDRSSAADKWAGFGAAECN